ncbi:MAG: hypothetical protein ISS19_06595 [Bacteroidales bacterium]|nr:hypothetical protein [Bacteroidales bacterium]
MIKANRIFLILLLLIACQPQEKYELNEEVMASLGSKFKTAFSVGLPDLEAQIKADSTNMYALLGLSETKIFLYIFGYSSREETLPVAREAYQAARRIDPLNSGVQKLTGVFNLLDWKWSEVEPAFQKAIQADPQNLNARHWYSLYLASMGRFDEAMAQHDTIATMDTNEDYLVGRGSMMYFARRNEELKQLMLKAVAKDTTAPWGYDWLGMAYCELEDFNNSLETYFKAFELSDGTVEVGGGLGHALGLAGKYDLAKQMADYYTLAAEDHYLPPVQRAFIHIGIGEYDIAIELLERAYNEKSWFLVFIRVEPWFDPIRDDKRFADIMSRMEFPD